MLAWMSLHRPGLIVGPGRWPSHALARDAQSLAGGAMVLVGLVVLHKERGFPGYWAVLPVLPVLGAVLIIASGAGARLDRPILSHRLLVSIGLISYPNYLWHCAYFDYARYRQETLEGTIRDSLPRTALDPCCYRRDPSRQHAVLLWGDSHAMQLAPGLGTQLPVTWQFLQWCPSVVRRRSTRWTRRRAASATGRT